MRDQVLWRKIARIIILLSEKLDVSADRAMSIFYRTRVSKLLHNPESGLYLMSDSYILEDLSRELEQH